MSKDSSALLRVATYNIHKGVRGVGPGKRLEIHNLADGVQTLNADLVFLQEVRLHHARDARRFDRSTFGWPQEGQAEFLAPDGYEVAYRSNAYTRDGEHGNALLSRWPLGEVAHHDVSDHRFEQRGLLHATLNWAGVTVHTVVAHLGLVHASRVRQVQRLAEFVADAVPKNATLIVAGDFNDWGERLDGDMARTGLLRARAPESKKTVFTFPSRVPVFALDRIYTRGLRCLSVAAPRGTTWARMSDHLPLVAEFTLP
jgi:endonuclease/exonuclease/phosphatase family metal-dependent hydrolase